MIENIIIVNKQRKYRRPLFLGSTQVTTIINHHLGPFLIGFVSMLTKAVMEA